MLLYLCITGVYQINLKLELKEQHLITCKSLISDYIKKNISYRSFYCIVLRLPDKRRLSQAFAFIRSS